MSESRPSRSKAAERRRARRHPATRLSAVRASILAGPDVEVVNVSPQGVLVASTVRLMPGAGICLNVWSHGKHHLLSGRIARVDTTIEGGRAKYHAGIALDSDFPVFDLPEATDELAPPAPETPNGPVAASESSASVYAPSPEALAELTALRATLQEQRTHEQTQQRTVEMLKAALSSSERARKTLEEERLAQQVTWDEERLRLQAETDRLAGYADELEKQALAIRERERSLERALEEERGMLATLLREKEQLLGDVGAFRAEAAAAAQAREELQQTRAERAQDALRHAAQLEATEAWCADQQELIYQLREDMLRSYALLEGWQSSRRSESPVSPTPEPEPASDPSPPLVTQVARTPND